jgi:hypothetical protein
MEIVTQLSLFLENRPGTLAAVCDALTAADINIFGLSISDTVDHSVIRLITSDPRRALELFEERGTLVIETDVLVVEQDNKPGTLSDLLKKLAKKKVNVEYAYAAGLKNARKASFVIRPDHIEKAVAALE